jgi:Carbonic anhydrase
MQSPDQIFVQRNIAKWVLLFSTNQRISLTDPCSSLICVVCLATGYSGPFLATTYQPLRLIDSQFLPIDQNARSALIYGVKYIENNPIEEVWIVGHTDCGGVKACYAEVNDGACIPVELRSWLSSLLDLAHLHQGQPLLALIEQNVRVQMKNVRGVLERLELGRDVRVRGFVYHLDGEPPELREIFDLPTKAE